jgi:hypothetical protein
MNFQPPEYDDPRDDEGRMNDGIRAMLSDKLGFSVEQQSGCPVIVEDGDAKPADLEHRVLWDEVVELTTQCDELLALCKEWAKAWGEGEFSPDIASRMNAAIAKAEGTKP